MSEFEHLLHRSAEVHSLNGTDRAGEQRTLSSGDETAHGEEETGTGAHDKNGEEESTNVHTNADAGIPFETDAEVIAVRLYHDGWASKRERRAVVEQVQAQLEGMFRDPRVSSLSPSANSTSTQVPPPWSCVEPTDLEMVQKATIQVDQLMERGVTADLPGSLQFWIDSHVHCSVDYDRLFTNSSSTEEQEWNRFRHCLREETSSSCAS